MTEFHLAWILCGLVSALIFSVAFTILNANDKIGLSDFVTTAKYVTSDVITMLFVLVILAIFGPLAFLVSLLILAISMFLLINILCKQYLFSRD